MLTIRLIDLPQVQGMPENAEKPVACADLKPGQIVWVRQQWSVVEAVRPTGAERVSVQVREPDGGRAVRYMGELRQLMARTDVQVVTTDLDSDPARHIVGPPYVPAGKPVAPGVPVRLDDLVAGLEVRRWTETGPAGRILTETPCCGRRVTLPPERVQRTVVCCLHNIAYCLNTEPEFDGGHLAVFTVLDADLVIATHHGGRST